MLIEIIFLQELSKDLSSNPHQLPAKVILIQMIGFSKKKKSSWINLHHFYSIFIFIFILFTFWKWTNLHISKKKKNKIFKKGLGTRGIRLVLLRFLSKKKKKSKFSIPWKNSRFLNFSKKKKKIINQKFQFHEKIQDFQNFQKRPWD